MYRLVLTVCWAPTSAPLRVAFQSKLVEQINTATPTVIPTASDANVNREARALHRPASMPSRRSWQENAGQLK